MSDRADAGPVLTSVTDGVATITLHRPDKRNAINQAMRQGWRDALTAAEADGAVAVVVLTGTDPAFCAGLDLKELATSDRGSDPSAETVSRSPFPERTKPLIGAINGAAVTGGFELALNCDFLIASDQAMFADTHARVGVMPGWGLTPLLVDAVGVRRAREISLSGNFVSAAEALNWGLVNRVVPHADLMPTTLGIAADIAGNDQVGVRRMLATYESQEQARLDDAWRLEAEGARTFKGESPFSKEEVDARRRAIIERGRHQLR